MDYCRGVGRLGRLARKGGLSAPDVVVASSPHPLVFPVAERIARLLGAKLIIEERDLWPLSLVELLGVPHWHPLVLWLRIVVRRGYRSADAVVSLLKNALAYMEPLGVDPARFHWIPNGVSREEWSEPPEPLPESHRGVLDGLRRAGKLIVLYAGGHGPPNALDQVLDLARAAGNDRPYHFVLLGEGPHKTALQQRARSDGIDFVTFMAPVPKRQLRAALDLADVCFIGWKDLSIYRYGMAANKLCDYMMAGKPILHAANIPNDAVVETRSGIAVHPYAPAELDAALRRFNEMTPQQRAAMGARGRAYILAEREWSGLGEKFAAVCEQVIRR